MNILILTGKFGMGHFSAAETLGLEIQKLFSNASVTVVDLVEYSIPVSDVYYRSFRFFVTRCQKAYNAYYKGTDRMAALRGENKFPLIHHFLKKLESLLQREQPDMIVCTLPICAQVVSEYKRRFDAPIPLITCITDVSTHGEWINPGTDVYLVPCESVKEGIIAKGACPGSILVGGIPVKEQFKTLHHRRAREGKNLLIMGGGWGLLPKDPAFYETLDTLSGVSNTIIAGNNRSANERLHGRYANIEVVGFTDEVYRYMEEADLIVTKPGGITLFESIFAELPLATIAPTLMQEIHNAEFIEANKIGRVLSSEPEATIRELSAMLNDDIALADIRANMRRLKATLEPNVVIKALGQILDRQAEAAREELATLHEGGVLA